MIGDEIIQRCRGQPLHHLFGSDQVHRKIKVCCPFHNDRNPSMVVFPNGGYKCFACGSHGNSIDFVVNIGYTFQQTLKELNK